MRTHLPFSLRGRDGDIEITVDLTTDPAAWGASPGAAARRSRADLDWLAHSFLCFVKDIDGDLRVLQVITGFSWGFELKDGTTTVAGPRRLAAADWTGHLPLLHAEHPDWRFLDAYETA